MQSAQVKADIWWNFSAEMDGDKAVEETNQPYHTFSYDNLGLLSSSDVHLSESASNIKRVTSWVRVPSRNSLEREYSTPSFSLSYKELDQVLGERIIL